MEVKLSRCLQNVELNEEDKKSINSLGEGEFGLLLPEKLKRSRR